MRKLFLFLLISIGSLFAQESGGARLSAGPGAPPASACTQPALGSVYTQTDAAAGQANWHCRYVSGSYAWELQGGGGGTPGGASGAIQYNGSGTFGGAVLTGLIKANGSSAPTAAVAGTDYPGLAVANTFLQQQTFSNGLTVNTFNVAAPPLSYCVFDGDSITTNGIVSPSSGSWPNQFLTLQWGKSCATVQNVAVSGNKIADRITAYPTGAHNYSPAVTGKPGYYFILIGANDIDNSETAATMFTSVQSLWNLAKIDGYTIVAFTVFPRGDGSTWSASSEQARQGLNSLIKSVNNTGKYDYLVDAAILLPDPFDTNFLQSDHIHPTIAGMTILAKAVTESLFAGTQHTPASTFDADPLVAGVGNSRTHFTALQGLTTGTNNTASGFNAGKGVTTGTDNTFYGYSAAPTSNPTKSLCMGSSACNGGVGSDSTFVGYAAAFTGATGTQNAGFGEQTLQRLTSGASNTAAGYFAGFSTATTSNNTYVGASSGQFSVAADATVVGFNACSSASTGSGVVCIGKSAIATSNNAMAVGPNASASAANGIALGGSDGGTQAAASASNAVQIGPGANSTANTVQYQTFNFLDNLGNFKGITFGLSNSGFLGTLTPPTLTAARTYTFKDASGTVAFTSDIPATIANTTITVGTSAVAANTCTTSSTATMTGATTATAFFFTPTADVSGVTGWGASGGLTLVPWPTANTLNYKVCNQTASSITPSASVTFNVGAR